MSRSTTRSSTRKLSEVARHLCIPKGITSTGWPAVERRLSLFRIPFDEWQQGLGRLILAKRENGSYAASVGGVVLSVARQVGKTYAIGWIIFALCTLFPGLTVIWTAHQTRTAAETFTKMRSMAKRKTVEPFVEVVRATNGEQSIVFKNGSRILFGARDQGFGLGFDKVDILVLDEAQRVKEVALVDMVPATNASPNGLVIMMGTPPRPTDVGESFSSRREDALAGDSDTLYIELSADPDAKVIDWEQIAKANPSYPDRTPREAILRMQKMIGSDENFRREAYGIWDEKASAMGIDIPLWSSQGSPPVGDGTRVVAVVFAWDGSGVSLAGAVRPEDGPIHVEGIRQAPMGEGTAWLVDWIAGRHGSLQRIVIHGRGSAEMLVNALRLRGVPARLMVVPSFTDVVAAHAGFEDAVRTGGLTHTADPVLDSQVADAVKRPIGKSGGFGWSSTSGESVLTLDAVTFAFWGANTAAARVAAAPRRIY